tara:strand:- start:2476 stop:2712 length:237 start_codon:yes stop_codon:yes gene_type:complete
MWVIVVVMLELWSTGVSQNALKITHFDGEKLEWKTLNECQIYTLKNIVELVDFSEEHYPPEIGKRIVMCVQQEKGLEL